MFLCRQYILFITTILIHVCLFFNFALTHPPRTLVTKLVHYLSSDSPFSKTNNLSGIDLSLFDLHNSIARVSSLAFTANTDDVETRIYHSHPGGFLAELNVGSYLTQQFVTMDTGSGLLWINCEPCGLNVPEPIFRPATSTTFRNETCYDTTFCTLSGPVKINCQGKDGRCKFMIAYKDSTRTYGYLARDSFRFSNSYEVLTDIRFGCARYTNLFTNGVMGLNNNRVSVLSQMETKLFGYCIGNISDKSYSYSLVAIGDDIKVMGSNVWLIIEDKYYLEVIAISIGGRSVRFDPKLFRRSRTKYTGGMVIDTGSTYTFIPEPVMNRIREDLIPVMRRLGLRRVYHLRYNRYIMQCYKGLVTRDLIGFPIIDFQFQGTGSLMSYSAENMFRQVNDDHFCLVLLPTTLVGTPFSILGNMMQQFHYMVFDLDRNRLSFQRIGCDKIYS